MTSTRNADLFDPERIPRQKLPDRPLVGETYPNGVSEFKMPSGRIELLWSYSTDGHFEA